MKVDIHDSSDVFAWIFILTIVGILGGTGVFIGVLILSTGKGSAFLGIGLIVVGLPMVGWMIRGLIQFNKQYHRDRIAAVKENPQSILVEWENQKGECLLTLEGLVMDNKFIAFDDYSYRLVDITAKVLENEQIALDIAVERNIGTGNVDTVVHHFESVLPKEYEQKCQDAIKHIRAKYTLPSTNNNHY